MSALRLQHPVSGASRGEWMSYMNHCNVVANIALALMHDPCGHRPHEDPMLDDSNPGERQEEQRRRADLAVARRRLPRLTPESTWTSRP
jgi:hypothetical protein